MNKIELLAPAGNLEKAKIAILYGADAVYIGGKQFSLRSRASNFDIKEIKELVDFANIHNSHVHVTVNMLPHENDLEGLKEYLLELDKAGVHAIIVASPAIMKIAKDLHVHYEVHVSTQHSSTNSSAVRFWKEQGMDRVVLGRECELDQIRSICEKQILPIEVFIHGGMCISYSGRCVLSNHLTLRDANRGGCAQSCRWKYHLMDGDSEISNPDNLFSMSSKDLQAVDYIEDFIKMGVVSLKIEGRMKSAYYLATVVSSYRHLIDYIYEHGSASKEIIEQTKKEIAKAENRPTGPGFYQGIPDHNVQLYQEHDETVTQEYVAFVLDYDQNTHVATIQVKNHFVPNGYFEIFGPNICSTKIYIGNVYDTDHEMVEVCNKPMQIVTTVIDENVEPMAMIRKIR
ncbi:peptidase U32 family protein [Floccifex sp.]|uniref:peptidase U32 family protein n=1 Tax=Floccifex sp. TaxID=2815810 RepID=UPI002A761656|nr:U32 family peptidase [Floccifex sp.]MDD7281481.1 U32 family peptidase [Erysipelotrichaceae bacterium]MDY2957732.1 U32 family peptidase [Floccifex sp.]